MVLLMSKKNDILKKFFLDLTGHKQFLGFSYARNGLFMLLKALPLSKGDEVIIPAYTCSSIPETILLAGFIPKLVDVNDTFTIDENLIEKNITKRTKIVYVIHTYGNPAKIDRIQEISKANNLILVEDVAHSFYSKYSDKNLGSYGDFTFFSLTKCMFNFMGGIVTTNNDVITNRLASFLKTERTKFSLLETLQSSAYIPFRGLGSTWESMGLRFSKRLIDLLDYICSKFSEEEVVDSKVFSKNKLGYLPMLIASLQIKNAPALKHRRKKNYENLDKTLLNIKKIKPKILKKGYTDFLFYFFIYEQGNITSFLKEFNRNSKIKADRGWKSYHRRKKFISQFGGKSFPITEQLNENSVRIPLGYK